MIQIRARGAPPLSLPHCDRRDRGAVEIRSADVVIGGLPCRPRGNDEAARNFVGFGHSRHPHRSRFDSAEHGLDVVPSPSGQLPAVVIEPAAAHPHHGVHRAGAAEYLAARLRDPPAVAARLWLGFERPVRRAAHLRAVGQRRPHRYSPVRPARLDQQHCVRRGGQPGGHGATRRAGADHHVVVDVHTTLTTSRNRAP